MFVWADATVSWPNRTGPGGSRGLDDYFTGTSHNIGAEIMGRNKSYPQRRPWRDHDWLGWRATNLRSTSSKEIWPRSRIAIASGPAPSIARWPRSR